MDWYIPDNTQRAKDIEDITVLLNKEFSQDTINSITHLDEGLKKSVYCAKLDSGKELAISVGKLSVNFEAEHRKLDRLHALAPENFPKSYGVFHSKNNDLFITEYLASPRLDEVDRVYEHLSSKELAENLGYHAGVVYAKTGMFTDEPHDGNILIDPKSGHNHFLDVDHFRKGTLADIVESYLVEDNVVNRYECREYSSEFKDALLLGYNSSL